MLTTKGRGLTVNVKGVLDVRKHRFTTHRYQLPQAMVPKILEEILRSSKIFTCCFIRYKGEKENSGEI